jgi:hypothetical protein
LTNACGAIRSPGWWKNYTHQNITDAQFYAYLKATRSFGATFAAMSQSAAIAMGLNILNLQGNNFAQQILVSELNFARDPALGSGTMVSYTGTLSDLVATAYVNNGAGNSAPYTNGNLTAQDKDVIGYLKGNGEFDSLEACRIRY